VAANFYRALEDKYRGTRSLVKDRLKVYLPFVLPLAALRPQLPLLDLGCGRGEWLELLQDHHIPAQGVDLDSGMLAACFERGLNVCHADAIHHLKAQPNASHLVVTGFHIAEHLPFDVLQTLFAEARRVLVPGGLLILETPNPENLVVGTASFYIDPTHQRPLPSQLLSFMAEHEVFGPVKLLRLQEAPELATQAHIGLYDVLGGSSPDYAIVAQVPAEPAQFQPAQPDHPHPHPQALVQALEPAFAAEQGLPLYTLATRYEAQAQALHAQHQQASQQVQQAAHQAQLAADQAQLAASQAHALALQLGDRAEQLAAQLNAVYASRAWRITQPLRWLAKLFRGGSGPG
jgi:O-antigen chain-terminating methyltransferase